ncbi:MAG: radical SAM protein [Thermodesulfovibrionales bacterium]
MKATHPKKIPSLLYANDAGEIIDLPDFSASVRTGHDFILPEPEDFIPIPEGSELFVLPGRSPVGFRRKDGRRITIGEDPFSPAGSARAVAAFVAPAHTSLYTSAYERTSDDAPVLPLFAYTAVGWLDGRFWAAAFRSDADIRQDRSQYEPGDVRRKTKRKLRRRPQNRLIQHLGRCCLVYGCPAARNYFLGRWEAPVPTSPSCNAACVGCISLQPSGCCPATQDRIGFVPTPGEIADLAVPHLKRAARPVVSFGQGCEGEPLLQAKVIEESIRMIRSETDRGTINLNTNASMPGKVDRLAAAGLDSIRVSMNSAREDAYLRYYRPKGFGFSDVKETIRVMKKRGRFVSINYFILPGFTDDPDEIKAFFGFVSETGPDMIQLRNLNMDPDRYLETVQHSPKRAPVGMRQWLHEVKKRFPSLRFGYYNPYLGKD